MPTYLMTPAFLLASSLFSRAGKLVTALFDDTSTDLYRLQPFAYAILLPYFAVLIVLSFYGLHPYHLLLGYLHYRPPTPPPARAARAAGGGGLRRRGARGLVGDPRGRARASARRSRGRDRSPAIRCRPPS